MHAAKSLIVAAQVVGISAAAQSILHAETAAHGCMYEVALEFLDKAPQVERESRDGRMLRARLLIQLERGREAPYQVQNIAPAQPAPRKVDPEELVEPSEPRPLGVLAQERELLPKRKVL